VAALWAGTAAGALVLDAFEPVEVKAAFVLNFVRYADWPAEREPAPDGVLEVDVVGNPELAQALARLAGRAGGIDGHSIVVSTVPLPPSGREARRLYFDSLRRAHVVFVGSAAAEYAVELVAGLSGAPVLTVADTPGFAAAGGMLGLVEERGRIVFEANPNAIRGAALRISSRVLKLARIVGPEPPG
jgi:hypothetical protein